MLLVLKIGWQECEQTQRINTVLTQALANHEHTILETPEAFAQWCAQPAALREGTALLFALPLPNQGVNIAFSSWLNVLITHRNCLDNCKGSVLIDGCSEFFTKKLARELLLVANLAGCTFPGKPLVEATGSLSNFDILAQINSLDNFAAYKKCVADLVNKLVAFKLNPPAPLSKQNLLVIHASIRQTSNTLLLWRMVSHHLSERANIEEVSLRNGQVVDCRGCAYETCLHFGEQGRCFYGGVMVDKVYPAVKRCDAMILLCPNYNDAVSANIMAFLNRLTALFRKDFATFATKKIYALVVSGYSGGDIVAEQILDALTCNKNFILPGHFALIETANAPQSILHSQGIEKRAAMMAARICP